MNLLQRFDRLIQSYVRAPDVGHSAEFRAAWDELERFIEEDESTHGAATPRPADPFERDFAVLGVPVGSSLESVRKAYRREVSQYHPDLFTNDPEKERAAAELTRRLTASFERIRSHYREQGRR